VCACVCVFLRVCKCKRKRETITKRSQIFVHVSWRHMFTYPKVKKDLQKYKTNQRKNSFEFAKSNFENSTSNVEPNSTSVGVQFKKLLINFKLLGVKVSISSTLYARVFCTNVVWAASFLVTCTLRIRGKSCRDGVCT